MASSHPISCAPPYTSLREALPHYQPYWRRSWRLHWAVSGPLTIAFVMGTSFRLFFPQFLRCGADVRALGEFVRDDARFFKVVSFHVVRE
uniref:Uncharacterized protein n=1 Tax=Nelumbo nucifera TaxID=4432 RepID=A0A822Z9H0_NELNU|nr:TPA_asm: hypothetical protein HUJ06_008819 [Nelumbo nucifera]